MDPEFGPLEPYAFVKIELAIETQLERYAEKFLTAKSVDEVLTE